MFELRHISFFQNGNEFTGSQGAMRYRILPDDDTLHVWTWYRDVCFSKADAGQPVDFPLSEEGLDALRAHLTSQAAGQPQPEEE